MTKTKRALEKLGAALEEAIERRQGVYGRHAEKWREGERGEAYQERTERLREMHDLVTDWTEEINE